MRRLSIFSQLLFLLLFACKKDETMVMVKAAIAPPAISAASSAITKVITAANLNEQLAISWSATDYGVTTQVTYTVQVDSKCNTFTAPVVIGTTNNLTFSTSLSDLNAKLLGTLHLAPNRMADLQIRVVSTINSNGAMSETSAPAPLKITPYSDQPVSLYMGENSVSAPVLLATGGHTYEGYKNIAAPLSFRLSDNPVCADTVLGSGAPGKLVAGTSSAQITFPRTGYYKIDVDTKALTLDTLFISTWGMIGDATPLGWDNSTPMTYDAASDTWKGSIALINGAIKFRANNAWDLNYGPASSSDLNGTLISTNDAVSISDPGTYLVTLNFSQAKTPYKYTYSIAKSGDLAEPAKLWLPGGYEGFDPSKAPTIYAISDFVYEGYVNIPSGTGFKFTSAPDYSHTNYGDSGTPGVLTSDGTAKDLSLGVAGYYKLTADIKNLTYGIYLVNSWGIIGTATPGQWDSSTPMTFDPATNTWSITQNLVNGALKFRANDAWDLNYGPASSSDLTGSLIQTNDAISIPADGNYTVTLDFTRATSPYQYTYTVKKN